jgi:alkanesulfonate monooxygenase SsuD/methylene tetrahydromethanopterin reductase-like flavin-dependent oxidoreductase (luciferase family)
MGLPNILPGTPGDLLVEWARRAEERGFSTLATIDRVAYPGYESLVALAAAAAVTRRIGLLTNILLAPTRNPVLLAKESASLDRLSGGRLTLGLAVGSREDDYRAVGLGFADRGRRFDEDLDQLHRAWRGEPLEGGRPVGPPPVNGDRVPILIGGQSDAAVRRVVAWGVGWTSGGAGPARAAPLVERIRASWAEAGREGRPRLVGLTYFALGDDASARAGAYLSDYYGPDAGRRLAAVSPSTPDALASAIALFEHHGYDEVILVPTSAAVEQVDLADEVRRAGASGG